MEETATSKNNWCKSQYNGQVIIEDKEAMLAIPTYTHVTFQSKSLCGMKIYQDRQCKTQQVYLVWPLAEKTEF